MTRIYYDTLYPGKGFPLKTLLKLCEWCGSEIIHKRREHFCSNECSRKYWNSVYERERNTLGVRPFYTWNRIVYEINNRDNRTCQKCGYFKESEIYYEGVKTKYRYLLEVHHIKPLVLGGSNLPENLITLCHNCHVKSHPKGYKTQARKMRTNQSLNSFLR